MKNSQDSSPLQKKLDFLKNSNINQRYGLFLFFILVLFFMLIATVAVYLNISRTSINLINRSSKQALAITELGILFEEKFNIIGEYMLRPRRQLIDNYEKTKTVYEQKIMSIGEMLDENELYEPLEEKEIFRLFAELKENGRKVDDGFRNGIIPLITESENEAAGIVYVKIGRIRLENRQTMRNIIETITLIQSRTIADTNNILGYTTTVLTLSVLIFLILTLLTKILVDNRTEQLIKSNKKTGESLHNLAVAEKEVRDKYTELKDSEARYYLLFNSANDAIFLINNFLVIDCNTKACSLFKLVKEEIIGRRMLEDSGFFDINDETHARDFRHFYHESLKGIPQFFETMLNNKNGEAFAAEVNLNCVELKDDKYVQAIIKDISQRKEAEQKINYMAYFDDLTGLPNRSFFFSHLESILGEQPKTGKTIAVLYIDIDQFKLINDTMGHDIGDILLKKISGRIKRRFGSEFFIARGGGDEFLLMINNIGSEQDIRQTAEAVLNILERPFELNNNKWFVNASIGIASFPDDGDNAITLFRNAEIAMYSAKSEKGNSYHVCSSRMKSIVFNKMETERGLRQALERDEFVIYYQPQVDAENSQIFCLEALIRWMHPEKGIILPEEFISLAEETGLIVPIGEWVIKQVCSDLNNWHLQGLKPVRVAVNLSVHQLMQDNFLERVSLLIDGYLLGNSMLEFEITENMAINDLDFVMNVLVGLKKIGLTIAIDDFGTDYSSLNALSRFPFDKIKIDKTFVHRISENDKTLFIVKAIVSLAGDLGILVVAEGVETESQLISLGRVNCNITQGYYFYHPMPEQEIKKLLLRR